RREGKGGYKKGVGGAGGVLFPNPPAGIPPEYRDRTEEKTNTTPGPQRPQTILPRFSVAPPPASTSYEVPLRREGNAMLVDAVVDGTMPVHLLLDTGAELTVLSTAIARSLALNLNDAAIMPLRSASGVFFAPLVKVRPITLANPPVHALE